MTRARGAIALPAALAALAVSAALGAAIAELVRTELALARNRRAAAAAFAASDACLAEVVAGLPPGWDFTALRRGPDGVDATADDGAVPAPVGCTATLGLAPGPVVPPRALLRIEGRAAGGRRKLEAIIGRNGAPGVPALLWLPDPPLPGTITGDVALDGADAQDPSAPGWAALAAPADPAALDAWVASEGLRVALTDRTEPALAAPAPPLPALAARLGAAGAAGSEALVEGGAPSASLVHVQGDLVVTRPLRGAGLLLVEGTLDIRETLAFTGIVAASGGVRISGGASLNVDGALWLGAPASGEPSLLVSGRLAVRQDRAAIDAADRLLTLPRRAVLLGLRDLA
jgi:hypothetical protein